MLRHVITELSAFINESEFCFELLAIKFEDLSKFVVSEENDKQWRLWGEDTEIRMNSEELRDASSKAICTIENSNLLVRSLINQISLFICPVCVIR